MRLNKNADCVYHSYLWCYWWKMIFAEGGPIPSMGFKLLDRVQHNREGIASHFLSWLCACFGAIATQHFGNEGLRMSYSSSCIDSKE